MAAYAALVSLMHMIEQTQNHPRPPIYLDQKQVESLTVNITFLQDFLEGYSHGNNKEAEILFQSQIAEAAYAAEDIIESQIVDQIHGTSTSSKDDLLYRGLHKVIQDMDFIKKDLVKIKEKREIQNDEELPKQYTTIPADSARPPPTGQSFMLVSDDVLNDIMDKLTGQQSNRQIIPIVGMGGIGKTTLAQNIYVKLLIVQHFDVCGWATVSQEYNVQRILKELLFCLKDHHNIGILSEDDLGEKLYKSLSGRRYLIVIDDIWSIEAWQKLKFFFPQNNNGSRIMITTRISEIAFHLIGSIGLEMNLLDEDESWKLLCKKVFGEEDCPS
ncbi:hypothetical protein BUALT_Bualt02G0144900 [Buddleja alternifolia]|uniref:NB-ARC domain-containing protein n=1 Tax=Buddleja alternifolia TaxID=168488 RepID=A0AAV6Y4F0_9LAMI|nr:hypothetical protein BUALT_Bualt02G0144900 [Buddleja alternifolia]